MNELNLHIPGFTIATKTWGTPQNPPILALHGWLDNANSFNLIAKALQNDYYFIAVDLPGHGYSSHLPLGCNYHFIDGIFIVMEIINALDLPKVHLLGHSMGACLASLVAGVVAERFSSLSLIEGLGPFSHPAESACKQLSEYWQMLSKKNLKQAKGYETFEKAVLARAASGYVSLDLARILCERGVIEKNQRHYWRHDRRLLVPSPLRMTEQQILSCLESISAPTYLFWASEGFSFDSKLLQNRIKSVRNIKTQQLEGGHHIHMEQPEVMGSLLAEFYQTL